MKKFLCISLIVILYAILIIYFIFYKSNMNFVLLGNTTIITYKNNEIKEISYINKINKRLDYEEIKMHNGEDFEKYCISFFNFEGLINSKYYKDCYEEVELDSSLAYHGDININVAKNRQTSVMNNSDYTLINQALQTKNISGTASYFNKSTLDIDEDGVNESIYTINNYSNIEDDKFFNYVFLVESNGTIIDINYVQNNEETPGIYERNEFRWAADIDLDNNYEIILSTVKGDDSREEFLFYKYNGTSFNQVLEVE